MSGYVIRKTKSNCWEVVDRKSGQPMGVLRVTEHGYSAESEQLKMQAEANDPWLILRMVFHSEEFHLECDGQDATRVTSKNVREVLR